MAVACLLRSPSGGDDAETTPTGNGGDCVDAGWGGHEATGAGGAEAAGGEPSSASPEGGGQLLPLHAYGSSMGRTVAASEPAGSGSAAAGRQRPALMPLPRRACAFAMPFEVP